MSSDPVLLDRRGAVAVVTLNRPDKLNSFDTPMFARFLAVFDEIREDAAVRAVLLTGAGRGFCAGQDISGGVPQGSYGDHLRAHWNRVARAVHDLDRPVVCAVNGVAAGAGANLALCADFVLAAEEAVFVQAFINIGLVPDTGGTFLLPRLVGRARANALLMLGEKLPAGQAAEWGLIHRVVPAAGLMAAAGELASRLAAMPTAALALTKRLLADSARSDLAQQLEREADAQALAGVTADHTEGVAAFRAKRPPVFRGA